MFEINFDGLFGYGGRFFGVLGDETTGLKNNEWNNEDWEGNYENTIMSDFTAAKAHKATDNKAPCGLKMYYRDWRLQTFDAFRGRYRYRMRRDNGMLAYKL